MVDYSRWEKLDISEDEGPGRPRVHAFKEPQSVTIGGPGAGGQVHVRASGDKGALQEDEVDDDEGDEPMEPSDEDLENASPGEDRREDVLQCRALAERALRGGAPAEAVRLLEKATQVGGARCPGVEELLASARRQASAAAAGEPASPAAPAGAVASAAGGEVQQVNGGVVADRYSWSQTREAVEVNIFVPDCTRAKEVAVEVTENTASVSAAGRRLLEGDWEFKVEPEAEPDWEVRDCNGRRAVRLTVRKAMLPGGLSVVVWWKRVLKGEPSIDIGKIEGRKKERTEIFAKAWDAAHLGFKEKVLKRTQIPVDVSGEG